MTKELEQGPAKDKKDNTEALTNTWPAVSKTFTLVGSPSILACC